MDDRLTAISEAIKDINRNLILLQGDTKDTEQFRAIEEAMEVINSFEAGEMHNIRQGLESK